MTARHKPTPAPSGSHTSAAHPAPSTPAAADPEPGRGAPPLGAGARCGEFIDRLVALLSARPEYVAERDVVRYLSLLGHFRRYRVHPESVPLDALPIRGLAGAIVDWSSAWRREPEFALLETYFVDGVAFVVAHAYGGWCLHRESNSFARRIPPILHQAEIDAADGLHNHVHSAQFKKDVTTRINRMLASVRVPSSARGRSHHTEEICLEPGAEFVVQLARCHLTVDHLESDDIRIEDDDEPKIRLAHDRGLYSRIVSRHEGDVSSPRLPLYSQLSEDDEAALRASRDRALGRTVRVPLAWITAVMRRTADGAGHERVPVPAWLLSEAL